MLTTLYLPFRAELDEGDPVQVSLEEQEGGQTGGDHGIALGQGFGGIADGIQAVGYLADFRSGAGHLVDAVGVIGDGTEGIHGQDVRAGHQHAHGSHGGAESAGALDAALRAHPVGEQQSDADDKRGGKGGLKTHGHAHDDIGGRAGLGSFGDITHRLVAPLGIVLGNENDYDAGDDADNSGAEEPPVIQHKVNGDRQADDGKTR